jgi:hypothetical protein
MCRGRATTRALSWTMGAYEFNALPLAAAGRRFTSFDAAAARGHSRSASTGDVSPSSVSAAESAAAEPQPPIIITIDTGALERSPATTPPRRSATMVRSRQACFPRQQLAALRSPPAACGPIPRQRVGWRRTSPIDFFVLAADAKPRSESCTLPDSSTSLLPKLRGQLQPHLQRRRLQITTGKVGPGSRLQTS